MSLLVVAPHPDDESIGCGGVVAMTAATGEDVTVVFLTSGELGLKDLPPDWARRVREAEARAAASILGVARLHFLRFPDWMLEGATQHAAEALASVLELEAPGRVMLPHPAEQHPDHAVSATIVQQAVGMAGCDRPTLQTYEVWTPMVEFREVENITPVMQTKLKAVSAYRSQLATFDYYEAVQGLNRFRGALTAHCQYAEVFGELELEPVSG